MSIYSFTWHGPVSSWQCRGLPAGKKNIQQSHRPILSLFVIDLALTLPSRKPQQVVKVQERKKILLARQLAINLSARMTSRDSPAAAPHAAQPCLQPCPRPAATPPQTCSGVWRRCVVLAPAVGVTQPHHSSCVTRQSPAKTL